MNIAIIQNIYQKAHEFESNSEPDKLQKLNKNLEEFELSTYNLR